MKKIQGIFSNNIANLMFLPRLLVLPYVDELMYEIIRVWLSGWFSFRTRKLLGCCILSKKGLAVPFGKNIKFF
jgi:hypothetical protein